MDTNCKEEDREVKLKGRELEERLEKEIELEQRGQLINDAKLRALAQGTPTYQHFRQIWMGAHLKPMAKDDKLDGFLSGPGSKVLWNSVTQNNVASELPCEAKNSTDSIDPPGDVSVILMETRSSEDVVRNWKKLSTAEGKVNYLKHLLMSEDEKSSLSTLWKEEVSSELLAQIVHGFLVLSRNSELLDDGNRIGSGVFLHKHILQILEIISNSRRFGITLSFLSEIDKKNLDALFILVGEMMRNKNGTEVENEEMEKERELLKRVQGRFGMITIGRMVNRY